MEANKLEQLIRAIHHEIGGPYTLNGSLFLIQIRIFYHRGEIVIPDDTLPDTRGRD
jgi:hypothetical protein